MKTVRTRVRVLTLAALAASGCGIFKKGTPKTPVVGERVAVLDDRTGRRCRSGDCGAAAFPARAGRRTPNGRRPAAMPQSRWVTSRSASPSDRPGRSRSARAASVKATPRLQRRSSATGKVFTIDTQATVRAFDAQTGATAWATQFGDGEEQSRVAVRRRRRLRQRPRLRHATASAIVAALDARNGGIVWQVHPSGPLRGSPTVSGDTLYVITQDNQIYSLKTSDGSTNWSARRRARNRRRVRLGFAGRRTRHRRCRLLVGRAQRLSLRERTPRLAGPAFTHDHPAPASLRFPTSTPIRSSTADRSSRSARAAAWSGSN